MSETKVQPTHLRRAAVVYVRQSTVAQVEQNRRPSACGENADSGSVETPVLGASPPLRGQRLLESDGELGQRSIPARAGATGVNMTRTEVTPVHPRACGGHFDGCHRPRLAIGAIPRARGVTRASSVGRRSRGPDNPRAVGAPAADRDSVALSALSPRVRGRDQAPEPVQVRPWYNIPADSRGAQQVAILYPRLAFIPAHGRRRVSLNCCPSAIYGGASVTASRNCQPNRSPDSAFEYDTSMQSWRPSGLSCVGLRPAAPSDGSDQPAHFTSPTIWACSGHARVAHISFALLSLTSSQPASGSRTVPSDDQVVSDPDDEDFSVLQVPTSAVDQDG